MVIRYQAACYINFLLADDRLLADDLTPNMWSVLEEVPWATEKNVHSLVFELNVMKTPFYPFDL